MHLAHTSQAGATVTEDAAATDGANAAWLRALARTAPFARGDGRTLPAMLTDMAAAAGDRVALLGEADDLTYAALATRVARYARWAALEGIGDGGTVALLLGNCPDYVAIWLGVAAARGVVALINTNLTDEALLHALRAVPVRGLIVGAGFAASVAGIADRLPPESRLWGHGAGTPWPRIDTAAAVLSDAPLRADEGAAPALGDAALYIYTSGTTGLPKAARVSHRRVAEWSCWFAGMIDTRPDDRMYNCLPLHHSTGGVVAVGAMLVGGASVLIRPRFSAGRFWDEVAGGDCTLFQYIGELCRYLADTPPGPRETAHRLRLCCGNGLRGDVWERFQRRFAIPRILEFYAATEGNVSLYNCPARPGAIGHVPAFLAHRFPVALVRSDPQTGALARDAAGLCVRCGPDEPGEALGRIGDVASSGRPFEGYTDAAASEAKVARDVLAPGDAWFRTGDLMRRDAAGFYYFVDRLGDTFRWKGENVATEEVAAVLRACPGVTGAAVYGVAIPGAEGRAGMAALAVDPSFDLGALRRHVEARLPPYARPVFLRLGEALAATATFKPAIALLAREGFDPDRVADALYADCRAGGAYVSLDRPLHARLLRGEWRP